MTNPTTPFSWQMPTSTDLVTDLPADFETFGQAVATSLADLLGGTTGQVLAKASNTDMDFTWVAQDDSNAIQNAIVDAKGDLIAASANDTPARLAVGNNGETLVADSSTATGLRYQGAYAAGKNGCINGGFDIWQRGTSFTSTGSTSAYGADRWNIYNGRTGTTYSRQTSGLTGFQYSMRVQRDSGNTSTIDYFLTQCLESTDSYRFAGQQVTLSFWAKAGANYSATGGSLTAQVRTGTGTDQNIWGGYTGTSTIANLGATLTTSWQRFSVTGSAASTATELCILFATTPVGTAGANDWFEITGVQLEIGSVATAFTRTGGSIQGELAACQRYFQVIGGATNQPIVQSYTAASAFNQTPQNFPVQMRVAPTATKSGTWTVGNCGQPSASNLTVYGYALQVQKDANLGTFYFYPDSSDDTITFSAEL